MGFTDLVTEEGALSDNHLWLMLTINIGPCCPRPLSSLMYLRTTNYMEACLHFNERRGFVNSLFMLAVTAPARLRSAYCVNVTSCE